MKTAISVPDDTFDRVDRRARELGLNRSQFYTAAAERWLVELDSVEITARLDRAVEAAGPAARVEAASFAAGAARALASLSDDEW
jgi:hypothetical protein